MPLTIAQGDIAQFSADALVNAANRSLSEGGGVCGALFKGAGRERMRAAFEAVGGCEPGQAVATPAFGLSARYVIHAVGPVYMGGRQGEEETLRNAYRSALRLAREKALSSIAFPLISAGIYGYPKNEALHVATETIRDFLLTDEGEMDVTLVLYDREDLRLNNRLEMEIDFLLRRGMLPEAESVRYRMESSRNRRYLEKLEQRQSADAFTKEAPRVRRQMPYGTPSMPVESAPAPMELDLQLDESFSRTLLKLIDSKGYKDAEVYKRANIDRRLFSKIRNESYRPGKSTVLALALALRLSRTDAESLLARAGYALSSSIEFDVVVSYFINKGVYDVFEINAVLFGRDLPLLGASS